MKKINKKSTRILQKILKKRRKKKKGNLNLLNIVKMVWGRLHLPPIPFSPVPQVGKARSGAALQNELYLLSNLAPPPIHTRHTHTHKLKDMLI